MVAEQVTHHGEVAVIPGQAQAQLPLHLGRHAPQHAVEDVIVPLVKSLKKRTAFSPSTARPVDWRSHDQRREKTT